MINRVEICGVNTKTLPVLSSEEKVELMKKIKEGDLVARAKFINGNLRLVLSIVQRFSGRGDSPDDLFQVGCIGLIKAIQNFDTSQNVQFSTYAVPMILGEIKRHLRDNNAIRVSRSIRDTAYKALTAREELINALGREPSILELSEKLELPCEDVVTALDAIQDTVSLSDPVFQDGNDTVCIMDQISDTKNSAESIEQTLSITDAIEHLPERERTIINLRFFQGQTQMEIAEEIGISQAQVSRLEKSALKNIRSRLS
ncbi:MAG: RNA polymerase sporulation sigma factor SigG [Clostridia bacterium]|nr:RNA polymerase sporulation sigma factor SigG [Clostridia bacterium]